MKGLLKNNISLLKLCFLGVLFFLIPFFYTSAQEGKFLNSRFDYIYDEGQQLYNQGKYKEAFTKTLEYADRSSWNGCKAYMLLSQINQKQNLDTQRLNDIGSLCEKVSQMTFNDQDAQDLRVELEAKKEFDLYDVLKLHFLLMGRFTKFGNSPQDEKAYEALYRKLVLYKDKPLLLTKNVTLFFHYSFIGSKDKKMLLTSVLENEDFFYKPIYLIYVLYTKGRTSKGFEETLQYENILREISFYQTTYKNLARIYFHSDQNYDKYLENIKNYKNIVPDAEKEQVAIWFSGENKKLINTNNTSYIEKLSSIFGSSYIDFLKSQLFFSSTGTLSSEFSSSGNVLNGIDVEKAFINLISYYSNNKESIIEAQKLKDPSSYVGLIELGVKVNTGSLGSDYIGEVLIPNIYKNIYFQHKDGISIRSKDFFKEVSFYQKTLKGIDPSSFTDKDRPSSTSGSILDFSPSSEDKSSLNLSLTQEKDGNNSYLGLYKILFLASIFSLLILIGIYFKYLSGKGSIKKSI